MTIDAISSGRFDVKINMTHIYDYKDVQRALKVGENNKRDIIKGVVKFVINKTGETAMLADINIGKMMHKINITRLRTLMCGMRKC